MPRKIKLQIASELHSVISKFEISENAKIETLSGNLIFPHDMSSSIVIHKIDSDNSKVLDKCFKLDDELKDQVFIIVGESHGLVLSTLAKLGFNNLFVLPQERLKLSDSINTSIDKLYMKIASSSGWNKTENKNIFNQIIGNSEIMKSVLDSAEKVSENPKLNLLITGETGTGKGLLANAIHRFSQDDNSSFIDVVCTAIPETLLESELFGHEKGAFTDAKSKKIGLFELADGGTIFLDEIGDMGLPLQAKLLRAIEKKVIRRLGGTRDIEFEARIISATNQSLQDLVDKNLFRRDLYFRLNVVNIELPPLRERKEDIPELTKYFVHYFNERYGKNVIDIEKNVFDYFQSYDWPGNIRELSNSIERGVVLANGPTLQLKNLRNLSFKELKKLISKSKDFNEDEISLTMNVNNSTLDDVVVEYAKQALEKFNGNKTRTAKSLGISRPKLDKLLS